MNNEFAFPRIVPEGDTLQTGLTKREWYAGLAMQGMLASGTEFTRDITALAFEYAQDMIYQSSKFTENEK